jgi:hypothetical protein
MNTLLHKGNACFVINKLQSYIYKGARQDHTITLYRLISLRIFYFTFSNSKLVTIYIVDHGVTAESLQRSDSYFAASYLAI